MPQTLFDYHPSVELLQSFLPPKALLCEPHNLKKAVRSYVLAKCTYGRGFTCSAGFFKFDTDWREIAQHNYYKQKKNANKQHDYQGWITCSDWYSHLEILVSTSVIDVANAQKTQLGNKTSNLQFLKQLSVKDLLFIQENEELEWRNFCSKAYKIDAQKLDQLLQLHPFEVTERAYRLDFTTLGKLGWLQPEPQALGHKKNTGYYRKVHSWSSLIPSHLEGENPNNELGAGEVNADYVFDDELSDFIPRFGQAHHQKLLFAAEYIIKYERQTAQRLEVILNQLETNWFDGEIQPLKLKYRQFPDYDVQEAIVYPVTFFYIKRSPYLFTIQQSSQQPSLINWYGYRLDRIVDLEILPWHDQIIPMKLREIKQAQQLPTIKEVELYCDKYALGYAFWKPKKWMLLRFNRRHYNRYIAATSRARIFPEIDLDNSKTIQKLVEQENTQHKFYPKLNWFQFQPTIFSPTPEEIEYLKTQTKSKQQYAFCLAKYYQGDVDVLLRLLSWGKNVKVLFPQQLQQQIFKEIQLTFQLYQH